MGSHVRCSEIDELFIHVYIKADIKIVPDAQGRSPQIAGPAQRIFQKVFPVLFGRRINFCFFPFGYTDVFCIFQKIPASLFFYGFLPRVSRVFYFNIIFVKNLLSLFTGSSSFTQISPVNFHDNLLDSLFLWG
jgi:hypothetical protein